VQNANDIHTSLLDNLSKLVGSFGLVLGIAYVLGLTQSYFFFSAMESVWVVGFLDAQALIKEGLLAAITLVAFTAFVYLLFPSLEKLGSVINIIIPGVSVIFGAVGFFLSFTDVDSASFVGGIGLRFLPTLAVCVSLVWSFRVYAETRQARGVVVSSLLTVLVCCFAAPYLIYTDQAMKLKWADQGVPLVINEKKQVLGVLVSSVSGKYLIYDCSGKNELILAEASSQLRVRPSAGKCL
jgi:hypothetical protein